VALKLLLDTTFLLPFFELDLGSINDIVDDLYSQLSVLYFAEISICEAKFKIISLYRKDIIPFSIVRSFWENLSILKEDEKIAFIPYDMQIDDNVNKLESEFPKKLEIIDEIIVATAITIGNLLTIDEEILNLKTKIEEKFGLKIYDLREITSLLV